MRDRTRPAQRRLPRLAALRAGDARGGAARRHPCCGLRARLGGDGAGARCRRRPAACGPRNACARRRARFPARNGRRAVPARRNRARRVRQPRSAQSRSTPAPGARRRRRGEDAAARHRARHPGLARAGDRPRTRAIGLGARPVPHRPRQHRDHSRRSGGARRRPGSRARGRHRGRVAEPGGAAARSGIRSAAPGRDHARGRPWLRRRTARTRIRPAPDGTRRRRARPLREPATPAAARSLPPDGQRAFPLAARHRRARPDGERVHDPLPRPAGPADGPAPPAAALAIGATGGHRAPRAGGAAARPRRDHAGAGDGARGAGGDGPRRRGGRERRHGRRGRADAGGRRVPGRRTGGGGRRRSSRRRRPPGLRRAGAVAIALSRPGGGRGSCRAGLAGELAAAARLSRRLARSAVARRGRSIRRSGRVGAAPGLARRRVPQGAPPPRGGEPGRSRREHRSRPRGLRRPGARARPEGALGRAAPGRGTAPADGPDRRGGGGAGLRGVARGLARRRGRTGCEDQAGATARPVGGRGWRARAAAANGGAVP